MRTGIRSVGALLLGLGLLVGLTSHANAQTLPSPVGIGFDPNETYADLYYQNSQTITPLVFPAATGGSGVTYTLTPSSGDSIVSLSELGLAFDTGTRTLSGTPTLSGGGTTGFDFTYTAIGTSASDTFNVFFTLCDDTAVPAGTTKCTAPTFASLNITVPSPQSFRATRVITPLTLPAATGGTGTDPLLVYTLTGLPAGLSFDPATRILSGTPTTGGGNNDRDLRCYGCRLCE